MEQQNDQTFILYGKLNGMSLRGCQRQCPSLIARCARADVVRSAASRLLFGHRSTPRIASAEMIGVNITTWCAQYTTRGKTCLRRIVRVSVVERKAVAHSARSVWAIAIPGAANKRFIRTSRCRYSFACKARHTCGLLSYSIYS